MTEVLEIPHQLPGLNEYSDAERTNRFKAAKMKSETQELIGWSILKCLMGIKFTKPVRLIFLWTEPNRKRDLDNICFAKKFILDALVTHGVFQGDGWKYVIGFQDFFMVGKSPNVRVTITDEI